jgi:DNA-binding response OmpR family regulator
MGCCPTCGQDIPPLMLLIDVTAGRVTHLGWEARLAPMECALLMALLRSSPQIVSYDRLLLSLYPGGEEPDWAASHLKVLVFRLRRKLKPMGLSIANSRSEGYALRADPEVIRAARRFAARRQAG